MILLLIILLSAFTQTPRDSAKSGGVEGSVVELGTGKPVPDSTVVFTSEEKPVRTVRSDQSGKFLVTALEPGEYSITVRRAGFVTSSRSKANSILTIRSSQENNRIQLELTPTSAIVGRIGDEEGRPKSYVQVQALRSAYRDGLRTLVPFDSKAESDDHGEYRLYGLEPGDYYVRASAGPRMPSLSQNFAPTYYPRTTEISKAVPVNAAAGIEIHAIDIQLGQDQTYTIRVRALPPSGTQSKPPVFFTVNHDQSIFEYRPTHFRAIGDNIYESSNFSPGVYDIYASITTEDSSTLVGRSEIAVVDRNAELVTMDLKRGTVLTGRVVPAGNKTFPLDLSRLRVALARIDAPMFPAPQPVRMDSNGGFSIPNVQQGAWRLLVTGLPVNVYVESVQVGTKTAVNARVELNSDDVGPLMVALNNSGGEIRGIVRNAKDQPIAGASVVLLPSVGNREDSSLFKLVTSDQNGAFVLSGLRPGEYSLFAAQVDDPNALLNADFRKDFEARALVVTVKSGSIEIVEIRSSLKQ